MNKFAILLASNKRVLSEVSYSFGNDPTVMAWATNPNDWEICEPGFVEKKRGFNVPTTFNGVTFDEVISDYVANGEGTPVAVAVLKPSELENQIEFPIFDHDGVYVIGENNGD